MLRKLALDWSPLRTSPSFRRLWLAQTVSFIGSEVGYVALTYQVYQLTGSTLAVGLLSLAQLVPLLTLTIVGGAFADVFDRRRLMLIQQSGMILGGAIVVTNAALPHPQVWPCYACMVVDACAFSFGIRAQHAHRRRPPAPRGEQPQQPDRHVRVRRRAGAGRRAHYPSRARDGLRRRH